MTYACEVQKNEKEHHTFTHMSTGWIIKIIPSKISLPCILLEKESAI